VCVNVQFDKVQFDKFCHTLSKKINSKMTHIRQLLGASAQTPTSSAPGTRWGLPSPRSPHFPPCRITCPPLPFPPMKMFWIRQCSILHLHFFRILHFFQFMAVSDKLLHLELTLYFRFDAVNQLRIYRFTVTVRFDCQYTKEHLAVTAASTVLKLPAVNVAANIFP